MRGFEPKEVRGGHLSPNEGRASNYRDEWLPIDVT